MRRLDSGMPINIRHHLTPATMPILHEQPQPIRQQRVPQQVPQHILQQQQQQQSPTSRSPPPHGLGLRERDDSFRHEQQLPIPRSSGGQIAQGQRQETRNGCVEQQPLIQVPPQWYQTEGQRDEQHSFLSTLPVPNPEVQMDQETRDLLLGDRQQRQHEEPPVNSQNQRSNVHAGAAAGEGGSSSFHSGNLSSSQNVTHNSQQPIAAGKTCAGLPPAVTLVPETPERRPSLVLSPSSQRPPDYVAQQNRPLPVLSPSHQQPLDPAAQQPYSSHSPHEQLALQFTPNTGEAGRLGLGSTSSPDCWRRPSAPPGWAQHRQHVDHLSTFCSLQQQQQPVRENKCQHT